MTFPDAEKAAAQGVHSGYTYTQRVCQELGQQPRRYNVRDPIPGSDWRNDGGWAIVLIRTANVRPAQYTFSNPEGIGDANDAPTALGIAQTEFTGGGTPPYGLTAGGLIIASNGTGGFVADFGGRVVIDRDGDGELTTADMGTGLHGTSPSLWYYERMRFTRTSLPQNYGAQYIRWANMQWCR